MSFYRIKYYPMRKKQYLHLYFSGKRGGKKREEDQASQNAAELLEKLSELEKSAQNLARARRTVRDLILCNRFEFFCTFTFNAEKVDRYDFKSCRKKITQVFMNYKNRYAPDFRYLVIPEFHKDGAVHFHGMVRGIRPEDLTVPDHIWKRNKKNDQLMLVPNTKQYVDWSYYSRKLGFFSCSAVRNYESCATYVSKYITKDLMKLPLGQRVFFASQNLVRPEVIFDEDDIPCTFQPDYKNEFVSVAESDDTYGLLPEWWAECCSDLSDPEPDEEEPLFPRLTGQQRHFYEMENLVSEINTLRERLLLNG